MAVNTGDTRFRKLDVDSVVETNFQDDGTDDISSSFNERDVENLLNGGRNTEALSYILQNAPIGSKNQALKDAALALALRSMSSLKSAQIDEFVSGLKQEQLDLLMKYIYRGFQSPRDIAPAALLAWHEKVYAKGSISSIIRVLVDSKGV
ncbi:hypothetical protein AAHC03_019484 [Spirometra sp. Aus1]|nr:unnamed protein product [Spirometra erinaceieuropaei]